MTGTDPAVPAATEPAVPTATEPAVPATEPAAPVAGESSRAPRLRPLALIAPLIVVGTLVAVVAVTGNPPPAAKAATAAPLARPVQGVLLVCPSVPGQNSDVSTRTILATARPGAGTALVQAIVAAGQPAQQQLVPLSAAVSPVTLPPGPPLVITATGPASGGLVGTRVTRGDMGAERGFSVDSCTRPRTDAWFVGASSAAGQDASLEITNADDAPAEVSVRALTPAGIVTPVTLTGIIVAPHSSSSVRLDQIVPNVPYTALEVVASRGRVASSMREHRGLNAIKPGGVDAVPQALGAQRTVTLAGVIGTVSGTLLDKSRLTHVLTVGDPGVADATVRVTVTDESGTFVPAGLDAIPVPAGTVRQVNLDSALAGERAVVRVTSAEGVPLVAGILIDAQARYGDFHETLHIGAAVPLTGATVFPDARVAVDAAGHTDTFLSFASLARSASVTVSGGAMPYDVSIAAGRTSEFKTHIFSKGDVAVVVTPAPGSPPIYAAATIEELGLNGPLIGGASMSGGLGDVSLPPAQQDAALPITGTAN